ncbi:DUF4844 domain-containing protein [Shewanella sp. GutCb]|nr:DUF4844 domain-containing protein [Shewanella sp. GutCb]
MHLRNLWFVVLMYLLTSCSFGEEQVLKINEQVVSKLEVLLAEKKFIEDPVIMYPGAPDEATRISAEVIVNDLTSRIILGIVEKPTKDYVLSQFKLTLGQFGSFDSEDADRALRYMERIMDILGIESSDGLFNEWRYGFEPA